MGKAALRELSDRELMEELVLRERQAAFFSRITAGASAVIAAALVIALLIFVPRLLSSLGKADEALGQVSTLSSSAETSLKEIDELVSSAQNSLVSFDRLAEDTDRMVNDNAAALERAMENFNSVDFDNLNTSIGNLSAVTERLNKVTSFFGG